MTLTHLSPTGSTGSTGSTATSSAASPTTHHVPRHAAGSDHASVSPVRTTGLTKVYGERTVVDDLDLVGSTVTVQLERGRLTVDDAGPGLPPEHRREVVKRFWRADEARGLPGSGLGLAIVADVVGAHAGDVQIQESPAGGTRVVLTLP